MKRRIAFLLAALMTLNVGIPVQAAAISEEEQDAAALMTTAASEKAGEYTGTGYTEAQSTGPLYWMAYETPFETDSYLKEERWDENVKWLSENGFVETGYTMMSTDGWIEGAQTINENGYVTKYNYTWQKDWKGMGDQLAEKGMTLGVYYDPLWITAAAYNSEATVAGTDIKVSSLVNSDYGHFSDFKEANRPASDEFKDLDWCQNGKPALYWLDTDKEGAEEYIKGYVKHFADAGATFLRVDFLGWYENGISGDNLQSGKPAYGTARYEKALQWMSEACDQYGVMLSLVMPNQYNHAETELKYGDMMRVNEDVANGGWDNPTVGPEMGWTNDHISGRRRGRWQKDWAQWGNSFDAFTGWADVGGRGQMILDGDFLRMARFDVVRTDYNTERKIEGDEIVVADAQKRSSVSLVAMAGSPICIADQYDTINKNAPAGVDNAVYYKNEEILALNKAGFVGKPMGLGESERWAGQLPDGSWVVALFNRDREVKHQELDFLEDLGIIGGASVRELWQHQDLGRMDSYSVDLAACDCRVLKITPDTIRYEAEVGSLRDGANSNENHGSFSGWGFADKLENGSGDVLIAVEAASGTQDIQIRYCNGSENAATAAVYVNGTEAGQISLPSTGNWDTWATVSVPASFTEGENLVNVKCLSTNGFNIDYIEIGKAGEEPAKKVHSRYEAEYAQIGTGAKDNDNHQLASNGKFVDKLDSPHWNNSKDTVKFTVSVAEEGDYDLTFRYANGGSDATADIFVNDKKLGYFTFPTVYQNAWDTWGEVVLYEAQKDGEGIQIEKVHLNAGENTVEYKHGNNAVNLDCLTITEHAGEQKPADLAGITIRTEPTKTEYFVGEDLDLAGMVLEAAYSDESTKEITYTSEITTVTTSGYDKETPGPQTITVTYMEGDITKTATFTVTVKIPVDKTSLGMAIIMGDKLTAEQESTNCFDSEGYAAVVQALDIVKSVNENINASQEEVAQAFSEFMTAYSNLVYGVQKIGLKTVIESVTALLADTEAMSQYKEESVAALQAALSSAEDVYKNEASTQNEINSATQALTDAVNTLVRKGNKELGQLIDLAANVLKQSDKYTSASVAAVQDALAAAQAVNQNPDATVEDIANAKAALYEALTSLEMRGNKAELTAAASNAAAMLENSRKYVKGTLAGLQEALTQANTVLENADAVQTEINTALEALLAQILEARFIGDVNNDGAITTADAAEVLKYNAEGIELTEESLQAADVNGDESIDTQDATRILKYASEMIEEF